MQINIGDKVRFLNEAGGGVVTKIVDNNKALVLVDDGFEIPYLLNELVIIQKYTNESKSLEKNTVIEDDQLIDVPPILAKQVEQEEDNETIIYNNSSIFNPILAFTHTNSGYSLYLINDGNYFLLYVLSYWHIDNLNYIEHGEIEPEMIIKIGTFSSEQLNQFNNLYIQIIPFNKKSFISITPKQYIIELDKLDYDDESKYQVNDYFDNRALLINLSEYSEFKKQKEQLKNLVNKNLKPKDTKPKQENKLEEIDLHIDKIVSEEKLQNMTAAEILDTQTARFLNALEGAIRNNTKRIVFIHGVGNGKLRYEIQRILKQRYPRLKYQDASFEEYGYGATMIILRK